MLTKICFYTNTSIYACIRITVILYLAYISKHIFIYWYFQSWGDLFTHFSALLVFFCVLVNSQHFSRQKWVGSQFNYFLTLFAILIFSAFRHEKGMRRIIYVFTRKVQKPPQIIHLIYIDQPAMFCALLEHLYISLLKKFFVASAMPSNQRYSHLWLAKTTRLKPRFRAERL